MLEAALGERDAVSSTTNGALPILVADLAAALLELVGASSCAASCTWRAPSRSTGYELACLIAVAHGLPTSRLRRGTIARVRSRAGANTALDSGWAARAS